MAMTYLIKQLWGYKIAQHGQAAVQQPYRCPLKTVQMIAGRTISIDKQI